MPIAVMLEFLDREGIDLFAVTEYRDVIAYFKEM